MNETPVRQQLNILVAEDDETDFLFLHCMLRKASLALLFRVCDGQEALDYLKGQNRFCDRSAFPLPDILLVDLNLPVISGHDILEWLQSQSSLQHIRKYVLAGSDMESDRARADRAGADDYFVKPLGLGHLAAMFEKTASREMGSSPRD